MLEGKRLVYRRLVRAVLLLVSVFAYGAVGSFLLLDGRYTLVECAHRTIVMLATINEAFPAKDIGAQADGMFLAFQITLVVFGIAAILYSLSTITAFFVEGELEELLRARKMSKEISEMSHHFIICGGGETGQYVAQELSLSGRPFLVVERDAARVERLRELGYRYVEGDASEESVLERAGIARAEGVTVALPTDRDNIYVTLTARQMNPRIPIIAKGIEPSSEKKLLAAGATRVVRPAFIGGLRMAGELVRPTVMTFMDRMMREPEETTRIEEIRIEEGCELAGQSIASSRFRQKTGLQVLAMRAPGQKGFDFRAGAETALSPGTTLIVIGQAEDIRKARPLAGMQSE
jgi:voltage-gated potassium channel